jgi:hypothetical protein
MLEIYSGDLEGGVCHLHVRRIQLLVSFVYIVRLKQMVTLKS